MLLKLLLNMKYALKMAKKAQQYKNLPKMAKKTLAKGQ